MTAVALSLITTLGALFYFKRKDSDSTWPIQQKLSSVSFEVGSWQNFKTSNTDEPDCDEDDTFGTASSVSTVIVSDADKGKWLCFKVKTFLGF